MVMKARATKQIYDILMEAVKARKQSGVPYDDALQIFLNAGDQPLTIVGVCTAVRRHARYSC
jgi:hypothetical protein